jgi:hypothetical protein
MGNPALNLSLTSHTDPMKTALRTYVLPVLMLALALLAWAGVLVVALHVSTIVLNTLDMIVELAAIT